MAYLMIKFIRGVKSSSEMYTINRTGCHPIFSYQRRLVMGTNQVKNKFFMSVENRTLRLLYWRLGLMCGSAAITSGHDDKVFEHGTQSSLHRVGGAVLPTTCSVAELWANSPISSSGIVSLWTVVLGCRLPVLTNLEGWLRKNRTHPATGTVISNRIIRFPTAIILLGVLSSDHWWGSFCCAPAKYQKKTISKLHVSDTTTRQQIIQIQNNPRQN